MFELKNIPEHKTINSADEKSMRKKCKDFDKYDQLFITCQKELLDGKRKLSEFKYDSQIEKGRYFILNGVLLYLETVNRNLKDNDGKIDGRLKIIFENGTESAMLLRSLSKRLRENGKSVSENTDTDETSLLENFSGIKKDDTKTGFIYIEKT